MNQYCRYCAYLCVGDCAYCSSHMDTMSDEKAKRMNHCKDFQFNPLDAFDLERTYSPMKARRKMKNQISLFEDSKHE